MYLKKVELQNVIENQLVGQTKACLYITDDAPTALRLKAQGEAVLVYLHSGNREQDFSAFRYAVEEAGDLEAEYAERVYRRCKGLPWNILDTRRCLIRETTVDDVEEFYRIYSHPSITEYMEDLYPEVERERQYVRDYIEKVYGFYEFGVWTVVEKESGMVIGRAGLFLREEFEEPELGFVIEACRQRKGYAFEVCEAILRYGREELGFEVIQALVEPGNIASLRLCEKLGMRSMEKVTVKGTEYVRLLWV